MNIRIAIGKLFKLKQVCWTNGINKCWFSYGYDPNKWKYNDIRWWKV